MTEQRQACDLPSNVLVNCSFAISNRIDSHHGCNGLGWFVLNLIDSLAPQRQNITRDVDAHIVCYVQRVKRLNISTAYLGIRILFLSIKAERSPGEYPAITLKCTSGRRLTKLTTISAHFTCDKCPVMQTENRRLLPISSPRTLAIFRIGTRSTPGSSSEPVFFFKPISSIIDLFA
jgi:hypothetical protein